MNLKEETMPVYSNYIVNTAVEECIEKGILHEFLFKQKAEVVAMSIYEYNEEYARKTFFEEGQEEGYGKGVADGKREGRKETLVNSIHKIMESLDLEIDKACELLGISVEEYELMSKLMDAEKSIREEGIISADEIEAELGIFSQNTRKDSLKA